MDRELERLRREKDEIMENFNTQLENYTQTIEDHLTQVRDEYLRVAKFSGQAGYVLDKIDRDFKEKTKLASSDIVFLFLCTSLQCARQYLLTNEKLRMTDKQNDKLKKDVFKTQIGDWRPIPPSTAKILTQSVPYDMFNFYSPDIKDKLGNIGLSGTTHRYRTLGHDPVLGWIFGTANIMTSALTRYDFVSFAVMDKLIYGYYPGNTLGMFENAINFAQQDPLLLPTAVARQAIHFGSDYFTKQGLPVPLIATVNSDLAETMITKAHIDMWSITRGAALSALINQLIATIHRLLYSPERDGSESMYEVRTRKILSYSNTLATGSNVIVTAFTKDLTKLDVGGAMVTLYRIISDYKMIHEIKRDFLKNEFYKQVVGEGYDFMRRSDNV